MGQITRAATGGITVNPTDRESGPGAGAGASGNYCIFLGGGAGQNAAANRMIVFGNAAADAGVPSSAQTDGLIVIGVDSLGAATTFNAASYPSVVVGDKILPGITSGPAAGVWIGASIGKSAVTAAGGFFRDVVIGANIYGDLTTFAAQTFGDNVLIGADVYRNQITSNLLIPSQSVVIGSQAVIGTGGAGTGLRNVIIGYAACSALRGSTENVFIGANVAQAAQLVGNSVIIGPNTLSDTSGTDNVMIGGSQDAIQGGSGVIGNVVLGASIGTGGGGGTITGNRNIRIGHRCGGNARTGSADNTMLIESYDGTTRRTILFGDMNAGSLVVGRSLNGTDRDTPGTNILKLITGTATGAAAAGGGFFYTMTIAGTVGVLRWMSGTPNDQIVAGLVTTVGNLPGGVGAGSRAIVTDAAAPAFNAAVVGGGAVTCPVYFNGAAWTVG